MRIGKLAKFSTLLGPEQESGFKSGALGRRDLTGSAAGIVIRTV
jgi:hypothetical protein